MNFKINELNTNLNSLDIYNIFSEDTNTTFLDSSNYDINLSRFSFIGINPFLIYECKNNKAFVNDKIVNEPPFKVLENLISKYSISIDIFKEIPFLCGCIGYISYDTCRMLENIPDTSSEDFRIPDMRFVFYNNLIIFDLINDKKYITSMDIINNDSLDEIKGKILKAKPINEIILKDNNTKFLSNFTKEEYKSRIRKLKNYIINGDVYIANMTQRFYCENNDKAFNIYRKLRKINKAPFSAFMNFHDFQIISSSPERFMQIINRKVITRPIKGTRPRGKSNEEDYSNKLELINSEKDKAELLMVVDLERNDLSKVCKNHSVKVTELFKIEEYATVFHLVSTIEGQLRDNISSTRCIKECFPGGSITGTPKIRTMEIIEELEELKRNIYTGSIGYFDFRGNADFNIVIRSILKKDNKAYFGVGGGITYHSKEEDEYNETLDKAKALMKVL